MQSICLHWQLNTVIQKACSYLQIQADHASIRQCSPYIYMYMEQIRGTKGGKKTCSLSSPPLPHSLCKYLGNRSLSTVSPGGENKTYIPSTLVGGCLHPSWGMDLAMLGHHDRQSHCRGKPPKMTGSSLFFVGGACPKRWGAQCDLPSGSLLRYGFGRGALLCSAFFFCVASRLGSPGSWGQGGHRVEI